MSSAPPDTCLNRSAEICTPRASAARSSAWTKRFAKNETLARSSWGGTGAKMKSTAPCGVEIGLGDLVLSACGDEDDRRHLRLPALADGRGRLEAVHERHDHVEQDGREVLLHHGSAGRRSRSRLRRSRSRAAPAPPSARAAWRDCRPRSGSGRATSSPRRAHRSPRVSRWRSCARRGGQPGARWRRPARRCRPAWARSRWRRRRCSAGARRARPCP